MRRCCCPYILVFILALPSLLLSLLLVLGVVVGCLCRRVCVLAVLTGCTCCSAATAAVDCTGKAQCGESISFRCWPVYVLTSGLPERPLGACTAVAGCWAGAAAASTHCTPCCAGRPSLRHSTIYECNRLVVTGGMWVAAYSETPLELFAATAAAVVGQAVARNCQART